MDITSLSNAEIVALKRRLDDMGAADPEEGARLHAEKNAPHVAGQYAHLRFESYRYQAYPKVLYREAVNPQTNTYGVQQTVVRSPEEHERYADWAESPETARANRIALEASVATAAAESAWADRHLSEPAQRERQAADEASEGHLVEVPEAPKRGRPRKDPVHG